MAAKMLGRTLEACLHGHGCRDCNPARPGKAKRSAKRSAKRTERTAWKREVIL